jgi:hypothetical protein
MVPARAVGNVHHTGLVAHVGDRRRRYLSSDQSPTTLRTNSHSLLARRTRRSPQTAAPLVGRSRPRRRSNRQGCPSPRGAVRWHAWRAPNHRRAFTPVRGTGGGRGDFELWNRNCRFPGRRGQCLRAGKECGRGDIPGETPGSRRLPAQIPGGHLKVSKK